MQPWLAGGHGRAVRIQLGASRTQSATSGCELRMDWELKVQSKEANGFRKGKSTVGATL